MAYTHFGARLARLGRFDSCTLYQTFAPVERRRAILRSRLWQSDSSSARNVLNFMSTHTGDIAGLCILWPI